MLVCFSSGLLKRYSWITACSFGLGGVSSRAGVANDMLGCLVCVGWIRFGNKAPMGWSCLRWEVPSLVATQALLQAVIANVVVLFSSYSYKSIICLKCI